MSDHQAPAVSPLGSRGRTVDLEPSTADLTDSGRLLAICAPLADMEPWQVVNFIRGIEHDAASRALLSAAAAIRARGETLPQVLAMLDRWARRPDRHVR